MQWIGHAGLAAARGGGTPNERTLEDACRLGVDWLEVDVWPSSDGELVLRHSGRLRGRRIDQAPLALLRTDEPELLTLDEADEVCGGRVPLLVDIKAQACTPRLADWLAGRTQQSRYAVCTDDMEALAHLRQRAPAAQRWVTMPHMGWGRCEWLRRFPAAARGRRLPPDLSHLAGDMGVTAVTVDHWALTSRLCAAAHSVGVRVAAWTLNRPLLVRRAARCGADLITTDHVAAMRAATGFLAPSGA